jgi:hypothetical protein
MMTPVPENFAVKIEGIVLRQYYATRHEFYNGHSNFRTKFTEGSPPGQSGLYVRFGSDSDRIAPIAALLVRATSCHRAGSAWTRITWALLGKNGRLRRGQTDNP